MLGTILIIILILALIGALPTWGHSRSWGYFPSGGLGLILVILIVLVLMGRSRTSRPRPAFPVGRGRTPLPSNPVRLRCAPRASGGTT
jgi:hypothetical protein